MSSDAEYMGCQEQVVSPKSKSTYMCVYKEHVHVCLHVYQIIGRHCCLWCIIPRAEMKFKQKSTYPARTVETITYDNQCFLASGGALSNAKFFNNCIARPLFNIPLDQV